MKSFQVAVVLLVACAFAHAEPPRFRSNRFQFQRQEQDPATAPQEEGSDTAEGPYPPSAPYPPASPAPYPPSNWKPSGRLFALPARQMQQQPTDTYGAPPPQTYGPPPTTQQPTEQPTTTETPEEETTDENVTTEPLSENVDVEDNAAEQPQSERLTQAGGPGFYYVQLPQLQQPQQQQYYLAPQVQSAQLKALPAVPNVAQPLVLASPQPLLYSSYYVSSQSW